MVSTQCVKGVDDRNSSSHEQISVDELYCGCSWLLCGFVDFLRIKFLKISLVNKMEHKWHGIVVIYLV